LPISDLVKSRLSLIMGTRGAAAKVEIKQVKKEIQARWNDLIWGCANDKIFRVFALCFESTGKENLVTTLEDEDIEKVNVSSLPVNPCADVPTQPSAFAIITTNYKTKKKNVM